MTVTPSEVSDSALALRRAAPLDSAAAWPALAALRLTRELPFVALANRPTPLQALPGLLPRLGVGGAAPPALWVKRDDLTGAELSGNKVRKLELLLADALSRGADTVLTCGGAQSNHCRATALAAARLGLQSALLLRTAEPIADPPTAGQGGNLLLDALAGAQVRFISPADYRRRGALLAALADELRAQGRRPYVIPEGGSNALGSLGYAACVAELAAQVERPEEPLTLVHATGSGGTGAGLLLGVARLGLPWRVVGVNVCDDAAYFQRTTAEILAQVDYLDAAVVAAALMRLELRDGYVGRGYALSRTEELVLLRDVCRGSGLVLDPVYTGKAFFGMVDALRADGRALGERVIFLHTGGIFGLFPVAAQLQPLLESA